MKVFVFSDIHFDTGRAEEIIKIGADIYILAGDISDLRDGLNEMGKIFEPLKEKLWIMPGNNETIEDIKKLCSKYGFMFFHDKIMKKQGYSFIGLGYSNPTPFNTPGEMSEEKIAGALSKARSMKKMILVCHAPPKNTEIDRTLSGLHVGSESIREFTEKESPIMLFCGHIHENAGKISVLNETVLFSAGKQGFLIHI